MTLDQAGAGADALRLVQPPAPSRERVELLWVEALAADGRGGERDARPPDVRAAGRWRIVSDHCAHVLYHRTRGAGGTGVGHRLSLVGPRTVAVDIDRRARSLTAGVRLRPWAVPALFDVPAGELTDRSVPLREILGDEAAELEARLREASAEGAVSVLAGWLARRPARAETTAERRARAATTALLRRREACARAAERVGVSTRTLRSLMREQVGLAPKVCARVIRLHAALRRAARAGPTASWARVAAASGYADQAHLIREFRSLLGETPGAWQRRRPAAAPGIRETRRAPSLRPARGSGEPAP